MRKKQNLWFFAALALVFLFLLAFAQPSSSPYEFKEVTWLNTPPLSFASLKGNVALVYFWSYPCAACLQTLTFAQTMQDKYGKNGFVAVGVYSPQYSFENNASRIEQIVKNRTLTTPLVYDSKKSTFSAYNAKAWPHYFLFNASGSLVLDQIGENQGLVEQRIRETLGLQPAPVFSPTQMLILYAGYKFAQQSLGNKEGFQPESVVSYASPPSFALGRIYLEGSWHNGAEALRAESFGRAGFAFFGTEVYAVASSPTPPRVLLNGLPLSPEQSGRDVYLSQGASFVNVTEPRLYHIASLQRGSYSIYLEVPPRFTLYSFSFR